MKTDQETLALTWTAPQFEAFLSRPYRIARQLPLDPEASTLKIIARDPLTGALGSLTIPAGSLRPH